MDSSLIPFITGGGGALVVLAFIAWAFFAGKLHSDREFSKLEAENEQLELENNRLRETIQTERRTSDELASTAQVTNKLFDTLTQLALERRQPKHIAGITPEDLGL